MLFGSQVEDAAPASGAAEDEDDFMEQGNTSRLGNFLRILLALGSSALVIAATFQSITLFSQQKLHVGYLTVVCALAAVVHLLTVILLSGTSFTSSKTNFSIGCLISALCSGALLPQFHFTLSIAMLTAQRIIQETGFAVLLHALPSALWDEMPSSVHYTIPLLAVVRGFGIFTSPLLNCSLEKWSSSAPNVFVFTSFSVLAVFNTFVLRSSRRSRRITSRPPCFKLSFSWSALSTILMVLNTAFTLTFLALLSREVFEMDQAYRNFVLQLLPSAILYFLSGPLVAVSIRWLPPRGFMLLISTILNIVLSISLDHLPSHSIPFSFGCLATVNGAQVILLHMHLVEGFSPRISSRHDITAGRVISVTISLSCIVSFLLPSWFRFLTKRQFSIFRSVYLCVVSNSVVSAMILVSILTELCAN